MKKVLVIVDETGGSSRPLENDGVGFGVGAIFVSEAQLTPLGLSAKELGTIVGNEDYKYKHVQKNREGRKKFVNSLRTAEVQCYGFFSSASGVAQEILRTQEAGIHYNNPIKGTDIASTEMLLDRFLAYAIPPIARHAQVNNYIAELWWDRRTDLGLIEKICKKHIDSLSDSSALASAKSVISFGGEAKGMLRQITRMAGVLAGDLRQYFSRHGERIWRHIDQDGLKGAYDPHPWTNPMATPIRRVASLKEYLADPDPYDNLGDGVMLQGYYQAFLRHDETGCRLISFCDPNGHMGVLEIEHGRLWHIQQLAD